MGTRTLDFDEEDGHADDNPSFCAAFVRAILQRVAATFSSASKKMPTSMPSIERPHRDGTWRSDMALMAAATHASKAKAEKRQKHVGRATPGGKIVVRVRRVDPDVESLEREHRRCTWIPGQKQIRPAPEARAKKDASTTQLLRTWRSLEDATHARIFSAALGPCAPAPLTSERRRFFHDVQIPDIIFFEPNPWPYQVEPGTEHWVLWFVGRAGLESDGRLDDSTVARALKEQLQALCPTRVPHGAAVDAVWYQNPKRSLPRSQHVQVFWRVRPS
jgi:hypothetical protein